MRGRPSHRLLSFEGLENRQLFNLPGRHVGGNRLDATFAGLALFVGKFRGG